MNLIDLVNVSTAVSKTRSRLKKRSSLSEALRAALPGEISLLVNYLGGSMPQGRIGLGPATVGEALKRSAPGNDSVSLAEVDRTLGEIAEQSGSGSKVRRKQLLLGLLNRVTVDEQRFLAGLVLGEVRQGALEGALIEAIADAADLPVDAIRRAVMLAADPAPVAIAAFESGLDGLRQFRVEPLTPIRPMLAQPTNGVEQAMQDLDTAVLQYKLDGARIQVHRVDDEVRIFTRQLHDVTARLPELVEQVLELPVSSLILDGEAIAFADNGRPLPFQVTMRRFGRSQDVAAMREKLPLSARYFDCLYAEGQELIDATLAERLAVLEDLVDTEMLVEQETTADPLQAARFLARAYEQGHEGVMAKALDSRYAAGNRGSDWLKIKQAHTLDLVVLAAEWGSGRRKGWLSNLHLGARDANGGYVMLGKTFKGLTDKMLEWQTKALLECETHRDGNTVHVRPELIAEIAVNDIQESPQYPAGLALRFARVKRYRDDKPDVDTIETVRSLFNAARA